MLIEIIHVLCQHFNLYSYQCLIFIFCYKTTNIFFVEWKFLNHHWMDLWLCRAVDEFLIDKNRNWIVVKRISFNFIYAMETVGIQIINTRKSWRAIFSTLWQAAVIFFLFSNFWINWSQHGSQKVELITILCCFRIINKLISWIYNMRVWRNFFFFLLL